jgi:hypothetical protein
MRPLARAIEPEVRIETGAETMILDEHNRYRVVPKSAVPSGDRNGLEKFLLKDGGNFWITGEAVGVGSSWYVPVESSDGKP